MTNLIDNGLKFGDSVEITLEFRENGDACIQVRDDGPGIPEEALEAVLQPFYRLENSRNRDSGGTGLGLAIAAQLAAQMQGKLLLRNGERGGLTASLILDAGALYASVSDAVADNLADKNP
jgi:signal transduction histidine kinase